MQCAPVTNSSQIRRKPVVAPLKLEHWRRAVGSIGARDVKPPPPPGRCLCFFDVEASGPSLKHNFVPCLGLAIVALGDGDNEPRTLLTKKWYIFPPTANCTWDHRTLREFWLKPSIEPFYRQICSILASSSSQAVTPRVAMTEFVALCRSAMYRGRTEVTLMSDTSGFDFSWLYYYLSHFGPADCPSPTYLFGRYKPVRDITSYFAGFGGTMNARYPHRNAMQKLGLSDYDWNAFAERKECPPYDHDPEHDAAHVGLRSAWLIWSMELQNDSIRDERSYSGVSESTSSLQVKANNSENVPLIVLVVRTDLRMRPGRTASQCAQASVALIARLPSNSSFATLSLADASVCKYRAPDAQTLYRVRDAARTHSINHHILMDDKSSVPTVLALGPANAASVRKVVALLKPFDSESSLRK